ncbi:hypothetical protein NERG_01363 [Nematocida ausubeli]|uniref:Uncharacterized protein n=1 Tax=Nematocida ausubeli (strain ATCC PRA-371 / ERTm2) TaxID=1913371 RepID=H8ZCC0_NEMA1|nr:hypothetical protein NERG_01363 [Nematocida ausubeli]
MESIVAYMKGQMDLLGLIQGHAADQGPQKVSAYILFESLKEAIDLSALRTHRVAVEKFFRKEYIPGLFSGYVKILMNRKMKEMHVEVVWLMCFSLGRLQKLEEVSGLEERLTMFLKTVNHKDIPLIDLVKACAYKGSSVSTGHFAEIVLENRYHSLYAILDRKTVMQILLKEVETRGIIETIQKKRDLLDGIAEYDPLLVENLAGMCVSYILSKESKNRRDAEINSSQRLEGHTRTIQKKMISEVAESSGAPLYAESKQIKLLASDINGRIAIPHSMPEDTLRRHREVVVAWLREMRILFIGRTPSEATDKSATVSSMDVTDTNLHRAEKQAPKIILYDRSGDKFASCITSMDSIEVLLMCEVCADVKAAPGSTFSRNLLLKTLEVTGDKEYIKSHGVSQIINIEEELQIRYDYYLSKILHKQTPFTLSLNLINLIIECGYHSRIVGLTIRLSEILKEMEYKNRNGFLLCNKNQQREIAFIPQILARIIRSVYIKKKDLQKIMQSIMYISTTENIQLVKGIYLVLAEIIYAYNGLDAGVSECMYGLKKSAVSSHDTLCFAQLSAQKELENLPVRELKSATPATSADDNKNNNTMTVSAEIFNILDADGFCHLARIEFMKLLTAMVKTTDNFLIKRLQNNLLPEILQYYIRNNILVNCSETEALGVFLLHISSHALTVKSTLDLVFLLMILLERNIDASQKIIIKLHKQNKYALASALKYNIDRDKRGRNGQIISKQTIIKIQKIFTSCVNEQ